MAELLQLLGAVKSLGDDARFQQHAEILDQHARIINELNATVARQARTIEALTDPWYLWSDAALGIGVMVTWLIVMALLYYVYRLNRRLKRLESSAFAPAGNR